MPSSPSPFVKKTFELVNDPNTNSIVSWSGDGNSFIIHEPQEFQQNILPFYFKHNNLCSFVRQLNTYGFHKVVRAIKSGQNSNILEFKQDQFIRGKPQQLKNINRRISGNKRSHSEAFEVLAQGNTSPTNCASSPEVNDDLQGFLLDRDSMVKAITSITARQEETKSQIQTILSELQEAKKLIEELESLPDVDESNSPPPTKKIKSEPEYRAIVEQPLPSSLDPIDEFWMSNTELNSLNLPCDSSPQDNVFDFKEFLFHENPCVSV